MKLRLIAGTINYYVAEDGWQNVHLDISARPIYHHEDGLVPPDHVGDISDFSFMQKTFREGTFHEARLSHVLEHLSRPAADRALVAIRRVLRHGGVLDVEVPDIYRVCAAYLNGALDHAGVNQWLYGEDLGDGHEPGDTHRHGWTQATLRAALKEHGYAPGLPIDAGHAARFRATRP